MKDSTIIKTISKGLALFFFSPGEYLVSSKYILILGVTYSEYFTSLLSISILDELDITST